PPPAGARTAHRGDGANRRHRADPQPMAAGIPHGAAGICGIGRSSRHCRRGIAPAQKEEGPIRKVIFLLIVLVGLGLLNYPYLSSLYSQREYRAQFEAYQQEMES